ncbi:MAG: Gfo/Idh/MocA family oxidoreductase [Opitutus sp.]|nr:Gfo/Idh/MocA family oxidoreductase [Opitutus sp.]
MAALKRILVVGAGWIGRRHLEALRLTGGVEVAVCESSEARRRSAADSGVSAVFPSPEDALHRRWDGAIVATPAHTHVAIGRALTDLGIPVLVEKPLAVTAAGVADWQAAVDTRGVPVMVGYVYRCHPVLEAIRGQLGAGAIGKPLQLVVQRGAHLPARRADYASSYNARVEEGGGVVHDILSHLFNAAEWLVGPVTAVAADAAHCCLPGVEVDDTVHVIARHGDVMASYAINQHQRAAEFSLLLNGTLGSLRALFHENRWEIAREADGGWTQHLLPPLDVTAWFARQAATFLEVIDQRRDPPCSLTDGTATLHAVLATLQSIQRRSGWVEVKPHVLPATQFV